MKKSLEELIGEITKFRDDRDWKQFHKPKDLALSLSIEVAELLECFQWKTDKQIEELMESHDKVKVEDELADIAAYLLLLCDSMEVDILKALSEKIKKNGLKYPIEKCKGRSNKYTEL